MAGILSTGESHSGTSGSTSEASFMWPSSPVYADAVGRGVLVFTFTNANADDATAVTYAGASLAAVAGGRAVDTTGEPGDCKAWFLGANVPQGSLRSSDAWFPVANIPYASTQTIYGVCDSGGVFVAKSGTANAIAVYSGNDRLGGTWSSPTVGATGDCYCVGYDGYLWVVGGASGKLYTTVNPAGTWTSNASAGFTNSIYGVAYGFPNQWVGVGAGGAVRATASGVNAATGTWTAASSPGFGAATVYDVDFKYPYWVAVGEGGQIRWATDPTGTWTAASSPGFGASTIYKVGYAALPYGQTCWVAVGDGGKVRYATDPTGTWTACSTPFTSAVRSVVYSYGCWVAGDDSGNMAYTSDPSTTPWTSVTSPGFGTAAIYDISPRLFAVGGNNAAVRVGGPTLAVTRNNNSNTMYAVSVILGSQFEGNELSVTGVTTASGDAALSEVLVDDGSSGYRTALLAAVNSGLSGIVTNAASPGANNLSSGANSEWVANIDFGNRVAGVVQESGLFSPGPRLIGFSSTTSDDVAAVYLAVQEKTVPWTVGIPIR